MRYFSAALFISTLLFSTIVISDTYVRGYTKSDGTYVSPHYRSSPDSSYNNNWSVRGNRNPYTGSFGANRRTLNDRTPYYNSNTYGSPLYEDSGNSLYGY